MDAKDYLTAYYSQYSEDNRLTARHGHVEFMTTMHYIGRYLKDDMRVLEIGAGTGRYSHALARQGYRVDAVELIEHNIEVFNQQTQPSEAISIRQGNALDLSFIEDNAYDITLLLGPMYHLFTRDDQHKALSEAIRVTKAGGLIFAAYCMGDASILQHGFGKGNIQSLIADGLLDPETFRTFSRPCDLFALHQREDILSLRAGFDVTPLHYVAADGYAHHMRQTLSEMDEETYSIYLKYHLATCERVELSGYSNHVLDIFRKN